MRLTAALLLVVACAAPSSSGAPDGEAPPAVTAAAAPTAAAGTVVPQSAPATCALTPSDALGPFYVASAPVRATVGAGYLLSGTVRSIERCAPLAGARVELWLANERGEYDDAHRATAIATAQGEYRFESNVPVPYGGRPPHIHIRVAHVGHQTLVTQHYPAAGQRSATFDLVLAR